MRILIVLLNLCAAFVIVCIVVALCAMLLAWIDAMRGPI